MRRPARWLALIVAIALGITLVLTARPYVRAAGLVVRAAQLGGRLEQGARAMARPVATLPQMFIPSRHGPVPAQVYEPGGGARRTVLLIPGIHPLGMREPRLVGLANELAAAGVRVVTFGLPDLMSYTITGNATDVIEDVVAVSAAREEWALDGRVGMIGISFSGGLSIVAAGRESIRDKVAFVVSFGGHGDVRRVMRYLAIGESPPAPGVHSVPPHDFGVAMLLYGLADSGVVPAEQAPALREAIATYLEASQLSMVDTTRADEEYAKARQMAGQLLEPSATFMNQINARDARQLGAQLVRYLDALATDSPDLSPERAASLPSAPVFLMHGDEDSIIPTAETVVLADHLRTRGLRVRTVITPLVTHAEVNRAAAASAWQLVTFWADVLRR